MIRCGFPANASGPTFFLPAGKVRNPVYTDEFLERNGAAKFSSVIMTPNGFLTDEAWAEIVPLVIQGLRHKVRTAAAKYGIDSETANELLIGLTFDGFKTHLKNKELLFFSENNILAAVEGRDSSEINQVCAYALYESGVCCMCNIDPVKLTMYYTQPGV